MFSLRLFNMHEQAFLRVLCCLSPVVWFPSCWLGPWTPRQGSWLPWHFLSPWITALSGRSAPPPCLRERVPFSRWGFVCVSSTWPRSLFPSLWPFVFLHTWASHVCPDVCLATGVQHERTQFWDFFPGHVGNRAMWVEAYGSGPGFPCRYASVWLSRTVSLPVKLWVIATPFLDLRNSVMVCEFLTSFCHVYLSFEISFSLTSHLLPGPVR